jgi:hypothetical protein
MLMAQMKSLRLALLVLSSMPLLLVEGTPGDVATSAEQGQR